MLLFRDIRQYPDDHFHVNFVPEFMFFTNWDVLDAITGMGFGHEIFKRLARRVSDVTHIFVNIS